MATDALFALLRRSPDGELGSKPFAEGDERASSPSVSLVPPAGTTCGSLFVGTSAALSGTSARRKLSRAAGLIHTDWAPRCLYLGSNVGVGAGVCCQPDGSPYKD